MAIWQYKVVNLDEIPVDTQGHSEYETVEEEFEGFLNALGREGWELVAVTDTNVRFYEMSTVQTNHSEFFPGKRVAYLKRPKSSAVPQNG